MKYKNHLPQIIIFAFAFIIYANTLGNKYALDDKMTFWKNEFVQNGASGIKDILTYDSMVGMFGKDTKEIEGGRYRPLSLVTFALEVEFFGAETTDLSAKEPFKGNPGISHFLNIILYCISLLILYKVLTKLFRDYKPKFWYLSIPFIATMLFAAHPLHTEIVANIKGRDEILAFLFSILALNSILNFVDKNNKLELINAFIFIFLGSMSKEITITFLAVIPLSIYFFRKEKFSKYLMMMIPLFAGALLYMGIRASVIGNQTAIEATMLMNNPFLEATIGQRYATIVLTLLVYLKLLIFPHPLTWDYYPYHIPIVGWTDWRVILGLMIYVALAVIAIRGFRKKSIYSFGILIFVTTLSITSNIFFNIGAFMSERFVFVSLLGLCLIAAYLISEKLALKITHLQKYRKAGITILVVVLLAFSVKTISRNTVWENNLSLFGHDVKISSNSAKGNSSYASELYKLSEDAEAKKDTVTRNKYLRESIPYFKKALEIYPEYEESLVRLGNAYYKLDGNYKLMFEYYIRAIKTSPLNKDVWSNTLGVLLYNVNDPEFEKMVWLKYAEYSPTMYQSYYQLGNIYYYSQPSQGDSAIYWYEQAKARTQAPEFEILLNLGIAYGNKAEYIKARENLLKAVAIKENSEAYRYIGVIYGIENNDVKALEYFEKALKLDPGNQQLIENIAIAKQRMGIS